MTQQSIFEEMLNRLSECSAYYGGSIPNDAALVWHGYFAALLEWGSISVSGHDELLGKLPKVEDNPVLGVFLGFDNLKNHPDG